ncbi:hypothetical protein [Gleimia europaea]|uniref:hypothetical protein n=1 Tax=Gleimia europaea TaxID=66228 RepID=UPI000C80161A|nr:hypothetical protein [Gleimia europaea]WIK63317.1 hypothetical protein CJ185_003160 [Gleimia europaea]
MRYVTSIQDIITDVELILASSDGKYDIEAIAYDVARTRETRQLGEDPYYITEDEGEFWDAAMRHALD